MKNATTVQSTNANANANASLLKVNLSAFTDKLASKNVEKTQKDRQHLYNYPLDFTKADLNGEKGKKFRQGLRNKIGRFSNNIFFYTKSENIEKLKEEIANFDTFYKENYRLNDFSVKSLSASDKQTEDLQLMLDIIKQFKADTTPKETVKAESKAKVSTKK